MNYKTGFYFRLSLLFALLVFLMIPFVSSLAKRRGLKSAFPLLSVYFKTNAQDAQEAQEKSKGEERKMSLGTDPPEAIKIMKISGYKSGNWLDDFELEIKNNSDKPIYYLEFLLETPEMNRSESVRELRVLKFGDPELGTPDAQPKDLEKSPHLDPGETITLKILERSKEAFKLSLEKSLQEGIVQTDRITKFILHIYMVKFADGSGYHGNNKIGKSENSRNNFQGNERASPASTACGGTSGCGFYSIQNSFLSGCVAGQTRLCFARFAFSASGPGPNRVYGIFVDSPFNQDCPAALPCSCGETYVLALTGNTCPSSGACSTPGYTNPHKICLDGECIDVQSCGQNTCAGSIECACPPGQQRNYWTCTGASGPGTSGTCVQVIDGKCGVDFTACSTQGASCTIPCPNSGEEKPHFICENGTCKKIDSCGKSFFQCKNKPPGTGCLTLPPPPPPPPPGLSCGYFESCYYSGGSGCSQDGFVPAEADCCCPSASPLIIDLDGNGYQFTSASNGVLFDIGGNGKFFRVAWPTASSADGWLALDRNSNGTIDGGKELFGNFTQQHGDPNNIPPNGFIALRYFDESLNGGNEDGKIDWEDNVYNTLRVWVDANHNGISESNELRTMQAAGVDNIDLNYYASTLTDGWGNRFKYKSQAWAFGWKTICDVYPNVESPNSPLFGQYDPIKVCDGTGLGTTMLGWNALGIASTQIRIGSPTGVLFAQGGPSGRAQTGKWVANGSVFYLLNASNGATLGTYTANISTTSGCP